MEKEISIHHQNKAKEIVDTMFDKNVFNQKFSRDDLQKVENLLAFYIHMEHESAKRALEVKFMLSRTIPNEHQTPDLLKFTKEREEDEKRKKSESGSDSIERSKKVDSPVIMTKRKIVFRGVEIPEGIGFQKKNDIYFDFKKIYNVAIPIGHFILSEHNFEIVN